MDFELKIPTRTEDYPFIVIKTIAAAAIASFAAAIIGIFFFAAKAESLPICGSGLAIFSALAVLFHILSTPQFIELKLGSTGGRFYNEHLMKRKHYDVPLEEISRISKLNFSGREGMAILNKLDPRVAGFEWIKGPASWLCDILGLDDRLFLPKYHKNGYTLFFILTNRLPIMVSVPKEKEGEFIDAARSLGKFEDKEATLTDYFNENLKSDKFSRDMMEGVLNPNKRPNLKYFAIFAVFFSAAMPTFEFFKSGTMTAEKAAFFFFAMLAICASLWIAWPWIPRKRYGGAFAIIAVSGLLFAAAPSEMNNELAALNCSLMDTLPVVSMLMIIASGILFLPAACSVAAYFLFKKEGGDKAKYSKWAAMIFGGLFLLMVVNAVFGIMIVIIVPGVLSSVYEIPMETLARCP